MAAFDRAVEHTLQLEGGFVNDPDDPGGATNWGITIGVFHRWAQQAIGIPGTLENLETLAREDAMKIYKLRYWDPIRLDEVAELNEALAAELFDTGVNMGTGTAVKFLQRVLTSLNAASRRYEDLLVDGDFGPGTMKALKAFAAWRGEEGFRVLHVGVNCLQGTRYVEIAEGRPASERFVYGWLKNRVWL